MYSKQLRQYSFPPPAVRSEPIDFELNRNIKRFIRCIMFRKQFNQRRFLQTGETDNLQNLMQAVWQRVFLLGDGNQEIGADRGPDLDADSIRIVAEKAAQAQVLLDPTKEQFDLPAPAIDRSDGECRQMEGVGQENEREAAFRIEVSDATKGFGIVLAAFPQFEADRLIAPHAAGFVDWSGLHDIEAQVAFAADHEEGLRGMKPMQPEEIEEAAIDHIKAVRLDRDLVERGDFVSTPLVQAGKNRNVCPEIEQHIELYGRMATLPPRPWEERQAQFDQRRIQREQSKRQIRLRRLVGVQPLRPPHQNGRHFGKHAPIPLGVRVSQIAALDRSTDAGVVQQSAPRFEAGLDVAQALPICQLREQIGRASCR